MKRRVKVFAAFIITFSLISCMNTKNEEKVVEDIKIEKKVEEEKEVQKKKNNKKKL
ncbi:hypothetical protein KX935_03940 [Streptobacillus moniliformis]|nr:hypothetical protein KX935_03940 [Streptobacillus moniliformis]